MKLILTLVLVAFLPLPTLADEVLGKPEATRGSGALVWELDFNNDERPNMILGDPAAIKAENSGLYACLADAILGDYQVRLRGEWLKRNDLDNLIPRSAECEIIKGPAQCPREILETRTIEGVYEGIECDEHCWLTLTALSDEHSAALLCDQEKTEKMLGRETGVAVSATYILVQEWQKLLKEDEDENAAGICAISPVFKSGRVIKARTGRESRKKKKDEPENGRGDF